MNSRLTRTIETLSKENKREGREEKLKKKMREICSLITTYAEDKLWQLDDNISTKSRERGGGTSRVLSVLLDFFF